MTTNEIAKRYVGLCKEGRNDWSDNHIVHGAEVMGPYPHDNRFAVRFVFDITNKPSNKRMKMDEVALFTIENGKITKEEFFYSTE